MSTTFANSAAAVLLRGTVRTQEGGLMQRPWWDTAHSEARRPRNVARHSLLPRMRPFSLATRRRRSFALHPPQPRRNAHICARRAGAGGQAAGAGRGGRGVSGGRARAGGPPPGRAGGGPRGGGAAALHARAGAGHERRSVGLLCAAAFCSSSLCSGTGGCSAQRPVQQKFWSFPLWCGIMGG